jgi:hypothetical protein
MAETITPGTSDRVTSLVRRRSLTESEAARWTTKPGFQFAEAIDLLKNGAVYATIYEIYGEGDPSTNYDTYVTTASKYTDVSCGAGYRRIVDDAGNAEWAPQMRAIIDVADDTTDFTAHPEGGISNIDLSGGTKYLRVKVGIPANDATKTITIA